MEKNFDFDKELEKLEDFVRKIEKPDTSLDESLKAYESGVKSYRKCLKYLEEMKGRITAVIDDEEVNLEEDFTE